MESTGARSAKAGPRTLGVRVAPEDNQSPICADGNCLTRNPIVQMKRHSLSLAAAVVLAGVVLSGPSGRGNATFKEATTSAATIELSEPVLQRGSLLRTTLLSGTRVVERYTQRTARTHFALGMSFALLDMKRVIERY